MVRRAVATVTLLAFLSVTWACTRYDTLTVSPTSLATERDTTEVMGILCKSGERINLPKGASAYVLKDNLVVTYPPAKIEIWTNDIDGFVTDRQNETDITLKNGRHYIGRITAKQDNTVRLLARRTTVPLSDVDLLSVRRVNAGKTALMVLGITGAVIGGLFLIVYLTKSSCPFVYSFDGHTYVLDAEPYGGATAPGLKRTEWVALRHLTESAGAYRLKVTNEVDETQYTDEVRLLVVDHPARVTVVPDEDGGLHTVADLVAPRMARDSRGRDILPHVADNDWVYWQTRDEDLDPELKSGVKESLVFEFPKPPTGGHARLVFNGGNTLWASHMLKSFLGLHGRNLPQYYASLGTDGPARRTVQAWALREELYRLHIRVLTKNGWVAKRSLVGGGPFVSANRIYDLDVSDVDGDVLKIQLTPPVGFWMINYVAVDYGSDLPVRAQEVTASRAVDWQGADIRPLLTATDDRYFVMPRTGESADLIFPAPPRIPGLEREVLLKASGYYDIHMGTLGEPRLDLLAKLVNEPGFGARMAWKEYLAYKQANGSGR